MTAKSTALNISGPMALNSVLALILAAVGSIGVAAFQYRNTETRQMTTIAEIVGAASTVPLSLGKAGAVTDTLALAKADRQVTQAAIYDEKNRLLAEYNTTKAPFAAPANPAAAGAYFEGGSLLLSHPIVLKNVRIGTVFLRSDNGDAWTRIFRYSGIVFMASLVSFVLSCLFWSRFLRVISEPIETFPQMAGHVSHDHKSPMVVEDLDRIESARVLLGQSEDESAISERTIADPLTELPDRIYFTDRLESAFKAANGPGGRIFGVLFVDMDRFKLLNNSLGYAAGDQVLVQIAERLRSSVCIPAFAKPFPSPTVARLGGDRFSVLIEGILDEGDAVRVAGRMLKCLNDPFHLEGRQVFATASIGIALSTSGTTSEDLLRNADTAVYHAKAAGAARFEVFDENMRERGVARLEIESDLQRGIEAQQLVLHYQPKLSLKDRRVTGFETVVRWNHPKRGLLYPDEFLPVAEESGLIVPLGRWVLREACRQMAAWHKISGGCPPLTIAINLSFKQVSEPGLVEDIMRVLAETDLDPASLRLEMTENSVMVNAGSAIATLRKLKALNIGLAIDDFGTGYSSLSYLRLLPFDTVKIDRLFTRELGGRHDSSEIIDTILKLVGALGMDVIAEGIETGDQFARLVAMGCLHGQGDYFSKPVEAALAEALLPRAVNQGSRLFAVPAILSK